MSIDFNSFANDIPKLGEGMSSKVSNAGVDTTKLPKLTNNYLLKIKKGTLHLCRVPFLLSIIKN